MIENCDDQNEVFVEIYSLFFKFSAKDKVPLRKPLPSTSGLTVSKSSNQPMAAIIRKPPQSNTKQNDPTNDAVAAINKNRALTVTARSVATTAAATAPSSSKIPPVATGVNNTFTLSPILSAKQANNSVTITPQLVQQTKANASTAQNPLSKANTSSPIPIAITKASLNQTTITKSPTPVSKPNGLGFRSTNTSSRLSITALKTAKTPNVVSSVPSSTRQINNNNNSRGVSPKILVQTQTTQMKSPFKPIIAQTKTQALAAQNTNKPNVNVVSKIKPIAPATRQQSNANANQIIASKLNSLGVEMRKRPANDTNSGTTAKRPKTGNSSLSSSVS